ncbi:unnamed protein product [Paramecium octaurelia]|uniref:Uncharacterized protein n=1 Tax=Paramecium octaurelia TaxID=43137 RepID=A0A8S1U7D1_PAROT|nr:unnamed protein product [Paramecium octaurelia]
MKQKTNKYKLGQQYCWYHQDLCEIIGVMMKKLVHKN